MGLGSHIVEALAREAAYKPLKGDALLIGRQTVYYTAPEILFVLRDHGLNPAIDPAAIEIDATTIDRRPGYSDRALIRDTSLLKLLGADRVIALDHSDYEGAEIVHDLRYPVPDSLANSADVLIDGSTLDNVFTPAMVLQNFTRLLRPGGRMFLVNAASSFESAYVIMPPMWFVDYFVMNAFADCRAYVIMFDKRGQNSFAVDLARLHALKRGMGYFPVGQEACTIITAEKGSATTHDRLPIQQHYRPPQEWETYQNNLAAMLASKRPDLARSKGTIRMPNVQGGFCWVNDRFEMDYKTMDAARPHAPISQRIMQRISALF